MNSSGARPLTTSESAGIVLVWIAYIFMCTKVGLGESMQDGVSERTRRRFSLVRSITAFFLYAASAGTNVMTDVVRSCFLVCLFSCMQYRRFRTPLFTLAVFSGALLLLALSTSVSCAGFVPFQVPIIKFLKETLFSRRKCTVRVTQCLPDIASFLARIMLSLFMSIPSVPLPLQLVKAIPFS